MKIGIFDSGLGGLLITRSIQNALPKPDIVYLGDTLHLPYGKRSRETIFDLTKQAVHTLFKTFDCQLVILACNTASASALRQLQQTYLNDHFPDRRILGVIVPTLEAIVDRGDTHIGLIGTEFTIGSGVYDEELTKLNPDIKLTSVATPLLVPLLEDGGGAYIRDVLDTYLEPFKRGTPQSLILGCTHYGLLKAQIQSALGHDIKLISQPDIIPYKLMDYLKRHPEHAEKISDGGTLNVYLTDVTEGYERTAAEMFGDQITVQKHSA